MPLSYQPLEVDDFSGGITDNLDLFDPKRFERADNLLINPDRKAILRPGSRIYNSSYPRPFSSEVSDLIRFGDSLLARGDNFIKYLGSSGWTSITGPDGGATLGLSFPETILSHDEWQGHLFLATSSFQRPVKIYKDEDDAWQVRTAGLPRFSVPALYDDKATCDSEIVTLANDIQTSMRAHFINLTAHPTAADSVSYGIAAGTPLTTSSTLEQTVEFVNNLVSAYHTHISDALLLTGNRVYHSNSLGNNPGCPNITIKNLNPQTYDQVVVTLNELRRNYNWHNRSFKGHPISGTNLVTTAKIDPEETNPIFSDIPTLDPKVISLVNRIKSLYNTHIGDTGAGGVHDIVTLSQPTAFAGLADTGTITLSDASEEDSYLELLAHLYQAYVTHQEDAAWPIYQMRGTTPTPVGSVIQNVNPTASPDGAVSDLIDNSNSSLYVARPNNSFVGSIVTGYAAATSGAAGQANLTISPAMPTPTMDGIADSAGWYFSKKKYHYLFTDSETHANATVTEVTFEDMLASLPTSISVLIDLGEKFSYHASSINYHRFAIPVALNVTGLIELEDLELTTSTYIYSFLYKYEYTLDTGELFIDRSAPLSKTKETTKSIEELPTSITGIPTIAQDASSNYDTDNIKIEIYRTANNQTVPRLVGTIDNGTTTFIDSVPDSALEAQPALYTVGGIAENDPPPKCRFFHIFENKGYYVNILDGDTPQPARFYQSKSSDIDSVPETFFEDAEEELIGVSSTKNNVVLGGSTKLFRVSGVLDDRGSGDITPQRITDQTGILSHRSMVQAEDGVFFAGIDGFYFTDAFQVKKLNTQIDKTYLKYTRTQAQKDSIFGAFDRHGNKIWWSVQADDSSEDRVCFVLHLDFLGQDSCFTICNGGFSFRPTALLFEQDTFLRAHQAGYVLEHKPEYNDDPKIDPTASVSDWTTVPIVYDYRSLHFNGGTSHVKKVSPWIDFVGNPGGNSSIQIKSVNDRKAAVNLKFIRSRRGNLWGNPTLVWGAAAVVWNEPVGLLIERRRFPATQFRYLTKQVQITNASVIVANSDTHGTCTLTGTTTKTATLDTANQIWPQDPENYTITFTDGSGNYTLAFTIVSNPTQATITFADPSQLVSGSAKEWQISGIPKKEPFHMIAWNLHWAPLGRLNKDYGDASTDSGANT